MTNQNPKQVIRNNICKQPIASGWVVKPIPTINLGADIGLKGHDSK